MDKENTAFCIACGAKKTYTVKSRREDITVRGTCFSYVEQTAYCESCGEEVYIPEINDLNVQAREDAYREAAGLITVSQINEILEKYHIGAGPLAVVMGFGEVTISRYLGGQLPSRTNSELLQGVRKSYKKMAYYLHMNGEKISKIAYAKCSQAIEELNKIYSSEKIETVTRYMLSKDEDITPMALQKILYYAQAFYKAFYDKPLFTNRCEAWTHGPVYRDVYLKYRDFGYDPIKLPNLEFNIEESGLTSVEISFLDAIIDAFGRYSGSTLRNMTHKEQPWLEARGSLLPKDKCSNLINNRTIDTYFKKVVEEYKMVNPCDISRYSSNMVGRIYH